MKFLIVDSCRSKSYICVNLDNKILDQLFFDPYKCSETFFVLLEKLLLKHPIESFDFLAVCKGPGSFTASRVTLMSIKTLSYAKKKPIVSFDSHIPLRANNFKNQSILSHKTKAHATLSTGGKVPILISLRDLEQNPPKNMLVAPVYNFKALCNYLLEKAKLGHFDDPLLLTPLYLKNP